MDSSNFTDFVQIELLASFLLNKVGIAKVSEFDQMLEWINKILENCEIDKLDKDLKFCIGIVLVGLEKVELFPAVFNILRFYIFIIGQSFIIHKVS